MNLLELSGACLLRLGFMVLAIGAMAGPELGFAQPKTEPGLKITFTVADGRKADTTTIPNVWLYVPAGKPPTPFLPGGKFTAVWEGFAAVDLRDSYTFQAELNGSLKLEVNGETVLEATSDGKTTDRSKRVRLNKGANALKVHFTSPDKGDALVRLFWSSPDVLPEPISSAALSHEIGSGELSQDRQLLFGRDLFIEHRCARCHVGPAPDSAIPELAMDAPTFEGIGSRRNYEWLSRWIADPKSLRPAALMPKMLHGPEAGEAAAAIAACLATLKGDVKPGAATDPTPTEVAEGKELFTALHCIACHDDPSGQETDAKKVSLKQVREKFAPGALAAFLQKPEAHFAWIRMPDFRLTVDEVSKLAAYLLSTANAAKAATAPGGLVEQGRKLLQTTGCLNCHALKLENQFSAKALADLAPEKWEQGCLAKAANESAKAPFFEFDDQERAALKAFAATDRSSLTRHVPAEFAGRQMRHLGCAECHGKFDGFPALPILGGKLKPEWMNALFAGEVKYKPRTWISSRMPAFPARAEALAQGLAMQHGFPPQAPPEPPVNLELAQMGRAMISTDGGFSCIACHAVREFGATQVFESAGINLGHAGERLQPAYFRRWLNNPLRIDPQTKMPVYFDQGRSPLADYFEGDASKQIDALWHYIRLGAKMPLPKEAQTQ